MVQKNDENCFTPLIYGDKLKIIIMYRIDLIMSYGYWVRYLNWLCMSLNLRV